MNAFKKAVDALPTKQPPAGWRRSFAGLLKSPDGRGAGPFPATKPRRSFAWNEALSGICCPLTGSCGDLDLLSALGILSRQAREKIFQPETDDAPVQIMGMLEAAGEQFDSMWVMGMDAESWPPPPRPNPVSAGEPAAEIQRPPTRPRSGSWHTPGWSPGGFCFSRPCCGQFAGKRRRRGPVPSPLISDFPVTSVKPALPCWWAAATDRGAFETIVDPFGPAADTGSRISGGTGLLKAQAACPFSAFAGYRLHAKALETPELRAECPGTGQALSITCWSGSGNRCTPCQH